MKIHRLIKAKTQDFAINHKQTADMDYHIFTLSSIKESNIAICNATEVNLQQKHWF